MICVLYSRFCEWRVKGMAGRGGRRPGAGRPVGSGKYGEPTKAVRVPESMVPHLPRMISEWRDFQAEQSAILDALQPDNVLFFGRSKGERSTLVALYEAPAAAGWNVNSPDAPPSETVDLVRHLSHHPDSSFLVTVRGDSMINAGINDGDLLLVDPQEEESHGRIVLAAYEDLVTVKRLHIAPDETITLKAENPDHPDRVVEEGMQFKILGTVISVIHRF